MIDLILRMLARAKGGKGGARRPRGYLTAFQILQLLPLQSRLQLIRGYGMPGRRSGNSYSAAKRVEHLLRPAITDGRVEVALLDTREVLFHIEARDDVMAGFQVANVYRLAF
jgi:hypothetical protein